LLKTCRNNGIMIPFQKTQYSSIPSFQVSKETTVYKSFRNDNSCTSIKSFLEKSDA
jgi:hypothetical protein